MKLFVTGGSGFIGGHLVRRLLKSGHGVTVFDRVVGTALEVHYVIGDLNRHPDLLHESMAGQNIVFHLAAHSDIPSGTENPSLDIYDGILATWRVLETMRATHVRDIVFASSSVVYGLAGADYDQRTLPGVWNPTRIPETATFAPISNYGASKCAAEALISSYCHLYGLRAWVFRFGNVVGPGPTHGVLLNFRQALKKDPTFLHVLGDGNQSKGYIYVDDLIDGMLLVLDRATEGGVWNIASRDTLGLMELAHMCIERWGRPDTKIKYAGGRQGWPGDVYYVWMDTSRIEALGWEPQHTSREAVARTLKEML